MTTYLYDLLDEDVWDTVCDDITPVQKKRESKKQSHAQDKAGVAGMYKGERKEKASMEALSVEVDHE